MADPKPPARTKSPDDEQEQLGMACPLETEQPEFIARFLEDNISCSACSLSLFDQLAQAIKQRQDKQDPE